MKRIFALTVILTGAFGLSLSFAGPERYDTSKVVQLPECDWTGWYIGGHGGYGGGDAGWRDSEDLDELGEQQNPEGGFAGIQIGYNHQINDWFVLGWEVSGSWSGIEDTRTTPRDFNSSINDFEETDKSRTENEWQATAALKAGFLGMNKKMLFYGKVGAALNSWHYSFLHDETRENGQHIPEFDRWSQDRVEVDPMFGLGMEYKFNCHWSAKLEYQHIFISDRDVTGTLHEDSTAFPESDENDFGYRIKKHLDTIQAGVNYHF